MTPASNADVAPGRARLAGPAGGGRTTTKIATLKGTR